MAKAPANLRSLARSHTKSSLDTLTGIASSGESESARVAAAIAILDRGWGKPSQPVTGEDGECPIVVEIIHRTREK